MKKLEYLRQTVDSFFWWTYDKQEIDLVEEINGRLYGYEMKYQPLKIKAPNQWLKEYTDASFEVIHQDNYLEFIR